MKRRLEKYSPDTREYFICQGILYVLDSSYFPEQKYREIKLYFSRYRERIQRLGDRYMEVLPQDAIGVRQEILRYGLPGDSTVKKMWVQN